MKPIITYLFENITHKQINPNYIQTLSYQCKLEVCELGQAKHLYFYRIKSTDFFIPNEKNRLQILAQYIDSIFSSLLLSVNDKGQIVKVHNLAYIRKKWRKINTFLRKECEGEAFEEFISQMEEFCYDTPKIIDYLQGYSKLGLLFGKNRLPCQEFTNQITQIKEHLYEGQFMNNSSYYVEGWVEKQGATERQIYSLSRIK